MGKQTVKDNLLKYIQSVEKLEMDDYAVAKHVKALSEDDLRKAAEKDSKQYIVPKVTTSTSTTYYRSPYISHYAKVRAKGVCQLCGDEAPFLDKHGFPYLESHHIKWLSQGGQDSIDNVVALCPNCHRRMHIVNDRNDVKILLNKLK